MRSLASGHAENPVFPWACRAFRAASSSACHAGDSNLPSSPRRLCHTRSITSSFSGTDIFCSGSDKCAMRQGSSPLRCRQVSRGPQGAYSAEHSKPRRAGGETRGSRKDWPHKAQEAQERRRRKHLLGQMEHVVRCPLELSLVMAIAGFCLMSKPGPAGGGTRGRPRRIGASWRATARRWRIVGPFIHGALIHLIPRESDDTISPVITIGSNP